MLKYAILVLSLFGVSVVNADNDELRKKIEKSLPDVKVTSLKAVDDTGFYEAVINGQILYFSKDGRYVIQGDMVSLDSRINLTEQRRVSLRKDALAKLDEKDMIIFGPQKAKYTITVFTDIDCGYCRKMHAEMEKYNDLGIRVRYLSFPRGGIGSKSYDDAVNVWCAADRQKAMTKAKQGQEIPTKTCANPVKAEFELGQQLGVQGTPSIFLESGQNLPGYLPPEKLIQVLDENSSQS
ncbi:MULTISPECIES: DsbC family protein [unclassified Methylophaga]|jgi:thiol:disulfide interchange protein DsbC|uniref:DsbC family protein n=1 Tax=unclassified Methylophaga TaxID=2629249 RepID=UPI0023B43530|nr:MULTISPECIES: DsbC family protein [unclassified Methylophaga]|tara:strand:- start:2804 stop:3517 length:714 start_codon:yes stop_codon:yes gene_type:complete